MNHFSRQSSNDLGIKVYRLTYCCKSLTPSKTREVAEACYVLVHTISFQRCAGSYTERDGKGGSMSAAVYIMTFSTRDETLPLSPVAILVCECGSLECGTGMWQYAVARSASYPNTALEY